MYRRIIYVTYADGSYEANFPCNSWFARYFMRAEKILFYTKSDLKRDPLYSNHRDVFDAPRGKGLWAWKPWAILNALRLSEEGDLVIYHDCGFGLRYKSFIYPQEIIRLAKEHGFLAGVRIPQHDPNKRWTHKRCIEKMGNLSPQYLEQPMTEAVMSFWTTNEDSKAFVAEWLKYCLDYEVVGDPPENKLKQQDVSYIEHRCDQSVLTNLVIKYTAPVIEPSQKVLPFAKSISLIEIDLRAAHSSYFRLLRWLIIFAFKSLRSAQGRM